MPWPSVLDLTPSKIWHHWCCKVIFFLTSICFQKIDNRPGRDHGMSAVVGTWTPLWVHHRERSERHEAQPEPAESWSISCVLTATFMLWSRRKKKKKIKKPTNLTRKGCQTWIWLPFPLLLPPSTTKMLLLRTLNVFLRLPTLAILHYSPEVNNYLS